ncbi:DUF6868 family protein [Zhongshania sp.]|uniref:DUF6868 family protein n=1 Tax=Zhongshania sp. TaxID=1971902 RepID=UPI0035615137
MTISQLTALLGWVSVINIVYLLSATIILVFMRRPVAAIHSKLFGLDDAELHAKYFDFLANYKIATLVFALAPYIALKIMGH